MRTNDPTDDLLALVAQGDDRAFDRLYEHVHPLVFAVIFEVLGDHAHSEEVTQEVFLELWTTASRYDRTRGSTRRWAVTIARRRAVDRARAARAARVRDDRSAALDATLTEPDPADGAERRIDAEHLRVALSHLTCEQRDLLVLAYVRAIPYRDLAALFGIPVGTVKSRVRVALERLRHHMSGSAQR